MKQRLPSTPWFILVLVLGLFLVACERPLQEPADLTAEPTTAGEETLPAYPGLETPAAPGLLPTPTSSAPGEETGGEEQPATEEGGEPTATAPETEEEAEPAGDVIHTVVAGDTLGDLANQYGVSVEDIAAANDLPDVHTLEVGQQLIIPLSGETGAAEEETPAEEAEEVEGGEEESPPAEERVHIVGAGDTLFRIGQQYGFTVDELVAYNSLANPDRLEIGQEIRIPPEGYTIEDP
ncbi:MAG: LysM peptidoglycan-binding domain-containing protein [Chloroflexota bacterium]